MTTDNHNYIGIDLGGSTIKGGLVNAHGEILYETRVDTEQNQSEALLEQILTFARALNTQAEGRAAAIGIGVPGLVNTQTNRIEVMPNLPEISAVDLPGLL